MGRLTNFLFTKIQDSNADPRVLVDPMDSEQTG